MARIGLQSSVAISQADERLQAMTAALRDRAKFLAEWASRTATLARRQAAAKGSGSGFWESDIAGSVEIVSVSANEFLVKTESPIAIHKQRGGPIRAKNVEFLTIPIDDEAKGKRASELSGGDRDLFRVEGQSGQPLLGYDDGDQFRALFVLVRETRPQRPEPWWPTDDQVAEIGIAVATRHLEAI